MSHSFGGGVETLATNNCITMTPTLPQLNVLAKVKAQYQAQRDKYYPTELLPIQPSHQN